MTLLTRRQLFSWWRVHPPEVPAARDEPVVAPPIARSVAPRWIDDDEPFSLEAFYAKRRKEAP